MLKKFEIAQEICRKVRITRRKPSLSVLTKREMLHLNSYLDVMHNRLISGIAPMKDVPQPKKRK